MPTRDNDDVARGQRYRTGQPTGEDRAPLVDETEGQYVVGVWPVAGVLPAGSPQLQ